MKFVHTEKMAVYFLVILLILSYQVLWLLERGMHLRMRTDENNTILHLAVLKSAQNSVPVILEWFDCHGESDLLTVKNHDDMTSLDLAADAGDRNIYLALQKYMMDQKRKGKASL